MTTVVPVSYEDDLFAARVAPRAMEVSPDALLIVSKFGEIRMVNTAAVRLTGWPRIELLHQSIEVLVPEHLRDRHRTAREQYMIQPVDRPMGRGLRVEMLHRDGALIPVEVLLGVLEADDLYIIATIRRVGTE
jgi:PAS domain S-box-containing protein